jgi:hypothetical protein
MSVRSLSRVVTTSLATGAISLGLTAPGLARPDAGNCSCGGARVPLHVSSSGSGSGAAARDQQKPIPQPPTWPAHPQTLTPPRPAAATPSAGDRGFQWDDAGIGAAGAIGIVLAGFGGTVLVRRRRLGDPALPA